TVGDHVLVGVPDFHQPRHFGVCLERGVVRVNLAEQHASVFLSRDHDVKALAARLGLQRLPRMIPDDLLEGLPMLRLHVEFDDDSYLAHQSFSSAKRPTIANPTRSRRERDSRRRPPQGTTASRDRTASSETLARRARSLLPDRREP